MFIRTFVVLVLAGIPTILCAQIPEVLDTQTESATGSGSSGNANNFSYTFPASYQYGALMVIIAWERDHKCASAITNSPGFNDSGGNWATNFGLNNNTTSPPTVTWGGNSMSFFTYSWTWNGYSFPSFDENYRAELSNEVFIYEMYQASFPSGGTGNIVISNFFDPLCDGDEMVVTVLALEKLWDIEFTAGNQLSVGGTSLSTSSYNAVSSNQQTGTSETDNLFLNVSVISKNTGTLTMDLDNSSTTTQTNLAVSNSSGDYNGNNQTGDFTEDDGLRVGTATLGGISGTLDADASVSGSSAAFINIHAFRVIPPADGLLPVEFGYFHAKKISNGDVELAWGTLTEQNNAAFHLEVSQDGDSFEVIDIVPSRNSESNELLEYDWVHEKAYSLNSEYLYYRIKQVDFNGDFSYSDIRSVHFPEYPNQATVKVYPNPLEQGNTLTLTGLTETQAISLYNSLGQRIFHLDHPRNKTLDIPGIFPPGLYYLKSGETVQKLRIEEK